MEIIDTIKKTGRAIEKSFLPKLDRDGDMDILDKLKIEHAEVSDLLVQLVDCQSGAKRKSLLKKIKSALVPHVRAEEKIVYNAIIAQKGKEEKINGAEGYLEHGLADRLLATLSKIPNAMAPEFSAGAKVLKEIVEHHVAEEERNVWHDLREHFDEEQRIQMNRKFETAKKAVRIPA